MRFTVESIGLVSSPVTERVDEGWGRVTSRIVIDPPYRPGLLGLSGFSHVIVITYLHEAAFDLARHIVRRPRGLPAMPEIGIFAQRAKDRPNPIGITAVRLIGVREESIDVQGLDAVDGTPVLDLKPYVPQYDRIESPRLPGWIDELMKGYF